MLKTINYINSFNLKDRRVLIRVDFNVPFDEMGNITDDTRIRSVLPTINHALDDGAKVILMSHLGRPKGKRVESMSLLPIAKRLSRLLEKDVKFAQSAVSPDTKKIIDVMESGDVVLLENLRFHKGETQNDKSFSEKLASYCDVYINDAFATAHRAHGSTEGITHFVEKCGAGFLMERELTYFSRALEEPMRPLVALIGGKKVSDKVGVLSTLANKVDKMIIGGGMALTFFKALGFNIGKSFYEDSAVKQAKEVIELTRKKGVKLYLPVDFVVADKFAGDAETKVVPYQEIPNDWMALDIGPATVALFSEALQNAKTIIWNGPMGVFELDAFSRGTFAMVHSVANSYALTIVGGGDTDVAVHRAGEYSKMSYISTGGGAFLELLQQNDLPAIHALKLSKQRLAKKPASTSKKKKAAKKKSTK